MSSFFWLCIARLTRYLGTWNAHRTVLQGQGLQGKIDRPVACCVNVGTGGADINDMDRHLHIGGGPG
jgi:hypothetical protein